MDRGHVGIMLRNWLRAGGEAEKAKACYVYPSVGGVFRAPVRVRPEEFRRRQDQTSGVGEEECEQRHTGGGTTTTRGREANISSCGRATKSRRETESGSLSLKKNPPLQGVCLEVIPRGRAYRLLNQRKRKERTRRNYSQGEEVAEPVEAPRGDAQLRHHA